MKQTPRTTTINFLWLLHASSYMAGRKACKSHKKLIVVVLGVCFMASGPGEAPHSCHTDARLRADEADPEKYDVRDEPSPLSLRDPQKPGLRKPKTL